MTELSCRIHRPDTMMLKVLLAVIFVTSFVHGQNDTQTSSVPFTCSTANGTAPDTTDDTCQRYWSCDDFNISLRTCAEDEAYSWYTGACVNVSQVPCQAQNEAFNETLANQTAAGRQKRAATHYNLPQFLEPSNGSKNGTSQVEIGSLAPVTVTLGAETCKHIGNNIQAAERVTNNALHLFTHCVFRRCEIEPVKFVCP